MDRAAANQSLFDWLREGDPLPASVDAIIGFGHFDLRIPRLCGELATRLFPRCIIFTGGIGAGTGDLGQPEADAFRDELVRAYPQFGSAGSLPGVSVITENRSTNTAENIRLTADLLARHHPALQWGAGIRSAVLVAHPSRLRRVRQTWLQLVPSVPCAAVAPHTDFATDAALLARQGVKLEEQISGEISRLREYPAKGWIAPIDLPSFATDGAWS